MGRKTAGQTRERHSAQRARPSPSKPSPPVTNCRKCSKIAALKRENAALREERELRERAARDGVPVTHDDAELSERMRAAASADWEAAVSQPGRTLRSGEATHAEKLRAADMLKGWMLGADTQRHDHRVKVEFDVAQATDEELDVLVRAREIVARLTARKEAA